MNKCGTCKYFRDSFCKNPDSPYGGKPRIKQMGCFAHIKEKSCHMKEVTETDTETV